MHHEDRRSDVELFKRLIDHPALDGRRRVALAPTPAVTGAVNQDHPMISSEPVAERLAHHFQI
jgi:hypothetical protein